MKVFPEESLLQPNASQKDENLEDQDHGDGNVDCQKDRCNNVDYEEGDNFHEVDHIDEGNDNNEAQLHPYQDWYSTYLRNYYYNNPYYATSYLGYTYPQAYYNNASYSGTSLNPIPMTEKSELKDQLISQNSPICAKSPTHQENRSYPETSSDIHSSIVSTSNPLQPSGMRYFPIATATAGRNFVDYTVCGSFNKLTGKFQRVNTGSNFDGPTVGYGVRERSDIAHKYFDYEKYIEEQGRARSSLKAKHNRRFTRSEIEILKKRKKEKKERKLRAACLEG